MAVLVIAEHDNSVAQATPTAKAADRGRGSSAADVHVLVAGKDCRRGRRGGRQARRRRQGAARRRRRSTRISLAEPMARADRLARRRLRRHRRAGHRPSARTSCRASPRCSTCRRSPRSSRSIAPDTFERPIYAGNAIATVQSTDAKKVITVRTAAFQAARRGRLGADRDGRGARPIRASRPSSARSCRSPTGRS